MKKIGIVVGSLRKDSFSKNVARTLTECAPKSLSFVWLDISRLELFNQDFDDLGQTPESYKVFRKAVAECDGYLFVTPEYNRSVPAAIKNALDVASRPYGQNVWAKKPGAVVSVSPGAMGGFGANHHLRQTLVFLDVYTMQQPETYVGGVNNIFDEQGRLTSESAKGFFTAVMKSFDEWAKRF